MANAGSSSRGTHNMCGELSGLSAGAIWKGENESDAELMEGYDSPLGDAEVWTEEEAYRVYREKLVHLRDLYVGQLDHLSHTLQEKRRQFLLQWQYENRRRKPGARILRSKRAEDVANRHYRRKSGEEALLERKLRQKRLTASLDYLKKDPRGDIHRTHYQYLMKQHHHFSQSFRHCNNLSCDNKSLPFSNKCSRHICDDDKQHLYTKCSYIYPSGMQCTNPIPKYLDPLLCGGHCDNIKPPTDEDNSTNTIELASIDTLS